MAIRVFTTKETPIVLGPTSQANETQVATILSNDDYQSIVLKNVHAVVCVAASTGSSTSGWVGFYHVPKEIDADEIKALDEKDRYILRDQPFAISGLYNIINGTGPVTASDRLHLYCKSVTLKPDEKFGVIIRKNSQGGATLGHAVGVKYAQELQGRLN